MLFQSIGNRFSDGKCISDSLRQAEKEVDFIIKNDICAISYDDDNYPANLADCIDAPVILFKKGNANLNSDKILAVVGTRRSTKYGEELCERLVADFKEQCPDAVIISGLAYGIDVSAHKASLNNNISTVGVLAHGLDRIYPDSHYHIARQMINNGALLSEYISGTTPEKGNFLARNRIIAGIANATLIVESSEKGGAMVTAGIASSYCRDLFAFPGRISDSRSKGCNNLIRDNKAALVTSGSDIIRMMNWADETLVQNKQLTIDFDLSDEEKAIFDILEKKGSLHITQLSVDLDISVIRLNSVLLDMEFQNIVKSMPGAMYRLACR